MHSMHVYVFVRDSTSLEFQEPKALLVGPCMGQAW